MALNFSKLVAGEARGAALLPLARRKLNGTAKQPLGHGTREKRNYGKINTEGEERETHVSFVTSQYFFANRYREGKHANSTLALQIVKFIGLRLIREKFADIP